MDNGRRNVQATAPVEDGSPAQTSAASSRKGDPRRGGAVPETLDEDVKERPREVSNMQMHELGHPDNASASSGHSAGTASKYPETMFMKSRETCWDLAQLPNGNVVLALDNKGLKEYSYPDRIMSAWVPPRGTLFRDRVSTVACTNKGQIVAGLIRSKSIALLTKDAKKTNIWSVEFNISTGYTSPYDVSVHGDDLLAYTGNRFGGRWRSPGRHVTLMKLSDRNEVVWYEMLDFFILRVSVTSEFVVVLSAYKQSRWGTESAYMLKAYNHSGYEQWKFASAERMEDIFFRDLPGTEDECQFLLAYQESERVGIICKKVGEANPSCPPDLWKFKSSNFNPSAVSANENGLAALSKDCEHVAWIPLP